MELQLLKSDKIDLLIKSLIHAKTEIHPVVKESKSHHGSYADLNSVLDAVTMPLLKQGVVILQPEQSSDDRDYVVTLLIHESGQYIGGSSRLLLEKVTSQGKGSAISYARRYSLVALLGLSQVDDDGNHATQEQDKTSRPDKLSPGDFKYQFGTLVGKSFKEVGVQQVAKDLNRWIKELDKKKEQPKGKLKDFMNAADAFIQLSDETPPAHISEDIPF